MSDLIERLRAFKHGSDHPIKICNEAADEIGLKTKALEDIRRWAIDYQHSDGTFEEDKDIPFLLADRALFPDVTKESNNG